MKVQLIGLGSVGKSLIELVRDKKDSLRALGFDISLVSVSDSQGTAIDEEGLDLNEVLRYKELDWKDFSKYTRSCNALDAIRSVQSDIVVELTPSTHDGEPGLSNIIAALEARKSVATANKGPLVVTYSELMQMARDNGVQLLYEATVAAHIPIFCMIDSCFKLDEILKVEGILNATTNFIIGEMEKGKRFEEALEKTIQAGWAETNYSDDIDGIDSARKVVILANSLFKRNAKLSDVKVIGIRNIEKMITETQGQKKKVKLICEIRIENRKLKMTVAPRQVSLGDPLATVNQGNMGIKFSFKTCGEVFVSAQFLGPKQTAYAVLNDILKIASARFDIDDRNGRCGTAAITEHR